MASSSRVHRIIPVVAILVGVALMAVPVTAQPTVIPSVPYVINDPGMYILDQSLTGAVGVIIRSDHVTLDLQGFALIGESGNMADGVEVRGNYFDIEVRNGTITGWGKNGVNAAKAGNSEFIYLRILANALDGLVVGSGTVVENVVMEHNCENGLTGADAVVVAHSMSAGNMGYGVELETAGVVEALSILENGSGGVFVRGGSHVFDNAIKGNGWMVPAEEDCYVATGAGITVQGEGTRVVDNVVYGNTVGIHLMDPGNSIARNLVTGSVENFEFVEGNLLELMLGELPEVIEWPAVVTLAGTLYGMPGAPGLIIESDDVTVDLGGHCLAGVPASTCGIFVPEPRKNLLVRNGIVRYWGECGINAQLAENVRLEDLRLFENGDFGAFVGKGSEIAQTVAEGNGKDGLKTMENCVLEKCTVSRNGESGLFVGAHSLVTNVVASENGEYGIKVGPGSMVLESTASSNRYGIWGDAGSSITTNTASFNEDIGISVGSWSLVTDNNVFGQSGGLGIQVHLGPGTRVEQNTVTDNSIGLNITGNRTIVVCNVLTGNGTPYVLHPTTAYGEFRDVSLGGMIVAADAWANFVIGP